ncbi:DUF4097 family beta strand repeat-containing protein [Candidatus Latescibacterota bacterium]
MKKFIQFSCMIVMVVMFSTKIYSESKFEDTMTMEFSDPSRPGLLIVSGGQGDVTINGYNGKEVIIKTKSEIKNLTSPPEDEKAKGLKRISGTNFHVATIEDENAIAISLSLRDEVELFIQVPFKTSLKLGGSNPKENIVNKTTGLGGILNPIIRGVMGGFFDGNIEVKNVSGEMEINTVDSNISLLDISGEAAVNTVDGDILVTFEDVSREKPMYFSAVDGDIDVTFPSDIQANLTIKCVDGDVFTDFEIDISRKPEVEKKKTSTGTVDVFGLIEFPGNNVTGKINGGGPEIQLRTIDGNIYLRKGK